MFPSADEVIVARRRVILKRWLYKRGHSVDPNLPTQVLVEMVKAEQRCRNVPVGVYRVCWAGCANGWGELQYAYKPIYGLTNGPEKFPHLVRVLADVVGGRAWINVHHEDVDTLLTNVPTRTVYSGETHAGIRFR